MRLYELLEQCRRLGKGVSSVDELRRWRKTRKRILENDRELKAEKYLRTQDEKPGFIQGRRDFPGDAHRRANARTLVRFEA